MNELKERIKYELKELNELYDYYLRKTEEEPFNKFNEKRLGEIRIEIRTYEKVLEMVGEWM